MAVVVYKCDVCKRETEKRRNPAGLETIQRCTITHGCRGKLYQERVLLDFIRGQLPDSVSGLDDWISRKVLHNHQQTIEQLEWTIPHNMGINPVVSVFVDRPTQANPTNQEEITPQDVVIVDDNTIKLVFEREYSGIAQLIARQSDPDLLNPPARIVETAAESNQFSHSGEVTIATLISSIGEEPSINLNIAYTTSNVAPVIVAYTADDQPNINSPWVDYNKVVIRGKMFTVRSYSGLVPEMTNGVIGNGSTFRFIGIDPDGTRFFRDIERGEVMILLSDAPHARVDKRRDIFIDVTDITSTENPFGLFYDTSEFYADNDVIQNVYPPIRSI